MATIANDTQFIGISPTIDLTGKKSAILNEQTIPVTMDDITSTVRPYNVFTALLTQSGGSNELYLTTGPLVIGTTYLIDDGDGGDDFTNVGAPNSNNGTSFIATGTTPANWTHNAILYYNSGAPVATVLENTIGNVWFSYNDVGNYSLNSNNLFTTNKTNFLTYLSFFGGSGDVNSNILFYSQCATDYELALYSVNSGTQINDIIANTPIEIRVYE